MFPIPQFQHFSISAFQLFPAAPHSRFKVQGSRFNGSRFNGSRFNGSRFKVLAGRREGLSIQSHIISMSALTHPPVET